MEEGDKEFIANEIGKHKVAWEKIEHDNQEEGKVLSEIFYEIQDNWGYDTTDIFMVCLDRVFDEPDHLLNVLDSEITKDVMDYIRSLRKDGSVSGLDNFAV